MNKNYVIRFTSAMDRPVKCHASRKTKTTQTVILWQENHTRWQKLQYALSTAPSLCGWNAHCFHCLRLHTRFKHFAFGLALFSFSLCGISNPTWNHIVSLCTTPHDDETPEVKSTVVIITDSWPYDIIRRQPDMDAVQSEHCWQTQDKERRKL